MRILPGAFLFLLSLSSHAQLQAYLNFNRFLAGDEGAYLETYLQVKGTSIVYDKASEEEDLSGKVEITQLILGAQDSIVDFKKYVLNNPVAGDSILLDILDQQRFQLDPGKYTFEISIVDLKAENPAPFQHSEFLEIPEYNDAPALSDLQLVESFVKTEETGPLSKSGYDLVPMAIQFFPSMYDKIATYFEIYNSVEAFDKEKFLVQIYIEDYETGDKIPTYAKMLKKEAAEVIPVIQVFNIMDLPSGIYNLVAEIRDKENNLLAQEKTFFQRDNPIISLNEDDLASVDLKSTNMFRGMSSDSLQYFLAALHPLATDSELRWYGTTLKEANDSTRQQFFYLFWSNRNPEDPDLAWDRYRAQIYQTNDMFGTTIKEGWETDRGRIFLKYGAPNTVTDRPNEPSSYPYQIWHYYQVGNFTNIRFIFYNPDLVTNDYELLHSNMRGEIQNYRWQTFLNNRNTPQGNIDNGINGNSQHWGSQSEELFNIPR